MKIMKIISEFCKKNQKEGAVFISATPDQELCRSWSGSYIAIRIYKYINTYINILYKYLYKDQQL